MKILRVYQELKKRLEPATEPDNRLFQDYYLTFSSPHGRRVMAHLLTDLHFFDEATTDQEVIERNIAVRILHNVGAFHVDQIERISDMFIRIAAHGQILKEGQETEG